MYLITSQDGLFRHLAFHGDLALSRIEGLTLSGTLPELVGQASFFDCRFDANSSMPEDLSDALFVDCDLSGVIFQDSNLYNCRFERCDLRAARFIHCNLAAAQWRHCQIDEVQIEDCDLDGASLGELPSRPPIDQAA